MYKVLKYIATVISCAYFYHRVNSVVKALKRDDAASLLLQNSILYPISIVSIPFTCIIYVLSLFFEPFQKVQQIIDNGPIALRLWPKRFDNTEEEEYFVPPDIQIRKVAFWPLRLLPIIYTFSTVIAIDSYKLKDKSKLGQAMFIIAIWCACLTSFVEEAGVLIVAHKSPAK